MTFHSKVGSTISYMLDICNLQPGTAGVQSMLFGAHVGKMHMYVICCARNVPSFDGIFSFGMVR